MSDPIADLLTIVRNGYLAKKKIVEAPYSRVKEAIVKILLAEDYLKKVEIQGKRAAEKKLVLELNYPLGKPALTGIKRVSRPGRRVYARADKIQPVRQGFGFNIVSTSAGLMTDKKSKKANLGGEVICQVW
jgi:small subunit ribosomal protein S8